MEAIIQRALAVSINIPAVDVIRSVNQCIISTIKGVMQRNQVGGGFDVSVRNVLKYSPSAGFTHRVSTVVRAEDGRELNCTHAEEITERSPLYLLRGIMASQSIKVNLGSSNAGTVEETKVEAIRFITEYLTMTMKNTKPIIAINRDITGKHAIEIELVETQESASGRYAPRPSSVKSY